MLGVEYRHPHFSGKKVHIFEIPPSCGLQSPVCVCVRTHTCVCVCVCAHTRVGETMSLALLPVVILSFYPFLWRLYS